MTMPTKPKTTGAGRPPVSDLDRRTGRNISLPASLWLAIEQARAASGAASVSAVVETYVTSKAHLPKPPNP